MGNVYEILAELNDAKVSVFLLTCHEYPLMKNISIISILNNLHIFKKSSLVNSLKCHSSLLSCYSPSLLLRLSSIMFDPFFMTGYLLLSLFSSTTIWWQLHVLVLLQNNPSLLSVYSGSVLPCQHLLSKFRTKFSTAFFCEISRRILLNVDAKLWCSEWNLACGFTIHGFHSEYSSGMMNFSMVVMLGSEIESEQHHLGISSWILVLQVLPSHLFVWTHYLSSLVCFSVKVCKSQVTINTYDL